MNTNQDKLHEQRFFTGDLEICYIVEGSGQPLLLIHGMGGNYKSFLQMIPSLSFFYKVYALDLRGHGKSDRSTTYDIFGFSRDIEIFVNKIIKKPVHIYGHSLGGLVGLVINERMPNLVKSLIFGDSPIFVNKTKGNKKFWENWNLLTAPFFESNKSSIELIQELQEIKLFINNKEKRFGDLVSMDIIMYKADAIKQVDKKIDKWLQHKFDDFVGKYNPGFFLKQILCPVLFLQADPKMNQVLLTEEIIEIKEKYVPQAIHATLYGLSHYLHIQNSKVVLDHILRFLITVE